MRDWWVNTGLCEKDDIKALYGNDRERLGYPTQKPVALLNRIIQASCPKGGIVLDPFCGCGTAMEAAYHNNMLWIGIDISGTAIEEIKKRLEKNGLSKDV